MKKQALVALIAISYVSPVSAQVGQIGTDGYYYITEGISPRTRYRVELSGTPTTRAVRANACGVLLIRPGQQPFSEGERFEVTDSATQQTYSFTNSSLPVKLSPKCRNGQLELADIPLVWKTSEGAIAVRGLTPESAMTLRMLDRNAKRTVTSNSCGFLRVKLPSPNPAAIVLNGLAFPSTGSASVPAVLCSRGSLYNPYPRPPVIAAVPETLWKQQNPPPVTPGAIALNSNVGSSPTSGTTNNSSDSNSSGSTTAGSSLTVSGSSTTTRSGITGPIVNHPQWNGTVISESWYNEEHPPIKVAKTSTGKVVVANYPTSGVDEFGSYSYALGPAENGDWSVSPTPNACGYVIFENWNDSGMVVYIIRDGEFEPVGVFDIADLPTLTETLENELAQGCSL